MLSDCAYIGVSALLFGGPDLREDVPADSNSPRGQTYCAGGCQVAEITGPWEKPPRGNVHSALKQRLGHTHARTHTAHSAIKNKAQDATRLIDIKISNRIRLAFNLRRQRRADGV